MSQDGSVSAPPPAEALPAHSTYRIQFVCTGNICRSPMAEVITRAKLEDAGLEDRVEVSSSGTGGWHEGEGADPRTVRALAEHGYDGSRHVAHEFERSSYADADLIVALDRTHERTLRHWAPGEGSRDKIVMMRSYDETLDRGADGRVEAGQIDVDDPWYGGAADFERCLVEVERASDGLVDWLVSTLTAGQRDPAPDQVTNPRR